jgi:hypothetical protein
MASCILSSCKNDASTNESVSSAAPVTELATVAAPVKVGQVRYDEAAFTLQMVSPQPIKVGETGALVITLSPKAPFHVNAEYPHRFKVSSTKGGNAPSSTVNRDPAKLKPNQLELLVPVVPSQAGGGELEGELSFSVCTEEKCLMEKRQLKATFQTI